MKGKPMANNPKSRSTWVSMLLVGATLMALALSSLAFADSDDPSDRVARIRYLQGSVSFQPAGESDWVAAVTNRPVTIGDQLWADASSRAELDLGSASIRMDADTGFSF